MILVIRIAGMVDINEDVAETLFRMRLRKKYTAVLLEDNEENKKLLRHIRNFVAYGKIDEATLKELIAKRGNKKNKNKIFHLHPPRGGIDSKIHFGRKKGVLGDNSEKINDLVRRML
jgi:ribosomal protein L30/L7E